MCCRPKSVWECLRANGTFTLALANVKNLVPVATEGRWSYSDGVLSLAPWLNVDGEGVNPHAVPSDGEILEVRYRFHRGLRLEGFTHWCRGGLYFGRTE